MRPSGIPLKRLRNRLNTLLVEKRWTTVHDKAVRPDRAFRLATEHSLAAWNRHGPRCARHALDDSRALLGAPGLSICEA